jgi:glycosyltransferase involved in cell wall biosynthesis
MKTEPLVSIIINNYNYDRFLSRTIDSALAQTYSNIEVIVVDDGSTDESRCIISSYGRQIIPVLKANSGQSSSFNEGFQASKGEIISFLDSDDLFHPEKIEKIVSFFVQNNLIDLPAIFHNLFEAIDEKGVPTADFSLNSYCSDWSDLARIRGDRHYTVGDPYFFDGEINKVCTPDQVCEFVARYRFVPFIGMPSSSVCISRTLADRLFPLPVYDYYKTNADNLMVRAASLLGSVYSTSLTLTQYRLHGSNAWLGKKATAKQEEETFLVPQEFLNSKLKEAGRKPVISFLESMPAGAFYRCYFGYNSAADLIKLSFKVILFRLDLETFAFFVKTLTRGIYYKCILLLRSRILKL